MAVNASGEGRATLQVSDRVTATLKTSAVAHGHDSVNTVKAFQANLVAK